MGDLDRLLSVAALVILNAVATRSRTQTWRGRRRKDPDPVTTAVVTSFGSWSGRPFAAVVLVAFLACGMSAQALTARAMYSAARDGVLPASGSCARSTGAARRWARSRSTAVVACLGLMLGLTPQRSAA